MSPYDDWLRTIGPSTVYRFYADDEELLYVGCTNDLKRRMSEHFTASRPSLGWQSEVRRIDIKPYPDRRTAEEAEATAIHLEQPLFNGPGGVNGAHRRLFGEARNADQLPRIRERIGRRLGEDPGEWAHRRRQEAERIPFADLLKEMRERTDRFCTERWVVAWASEFGEDPWGEAVRIAWAVGWKSVPGSQWAHNTGRWRMA